MGASEPRGADDQHEDTPGSRGWGGWRRKLASGLGATVPAGAPSRAATVIEPRERRLLWWELLVVLGIFPLASGVVPGLVGLVSGWLSGGTAEGGYWRVSLPTTSCTGC